MLHRRQFSKAVHASAQAVEAACVSEMVEDPRMNAKLTSLRGTKQPAVLTKNLGGLIGLVGRYVHCVG
jgi:hypothetical protein